MAPHFETTDGRPITDVPIEFESLLDIPEVVVADGKLAPTINEILQKHKDNAPNTYNMRILDEELTLAINDLQKKERHTF